MQIADAKTEPALTATAFISVCRTVSGSPGLTRPWVGPARRAKFSGPHPNHKDPAVDSKDRALRGFLLFLPLQAVQVIDSALGVRGCREDCALVFAENLQPVRQVDAL